MKPLKCSLGHPITWESATVGYCDVQVHAHDLIAVNRQWWQWKFGRVTAITPSAARTFIRRDGQE